MDLFKDGQMDLVLEEINVLIFPSMREGHPLYLLRSLAFGVVPIIYPNPGLTRDIIHEYNGLITVGRFPTSLLSALKKLHDDRYLLNQLSQNAYHYAATKSQKNTDFEIFQYLSYK